MTNPVSLAEIHDALSDEVRLFYNDMLREGAADRLPREWLSMFRYWLNEHDFEQRYTALRSGEWESDQVPLCLLDEEAP